PARVTTVVRGANQNRSPDGAQRNPGQSRCGEDSRITLALHPGYWAKGTTITSRIHVHEIPQQRIDLVVPALAGEHAVMADAGLHVVHLAIGAHAGAKVLRRQRLADNR